MTDEKRRRLLDIERELCQHDFPPQIVLETTAFCNFRCTHCHHDQLGRRKGTMSIELWKKLVDEIAEHRPDAQVWPTFYGEAMMLKGRLFDYLSYARDAGLTNMVLNSNGSYLYGEFIDLLLTSGLKRFLLSLDGFTRETFERIRYTRDPKGKHAPVYQGVRDLLARKRELDLAGHETPTIICQFSMMDDNEHEVEAFRRYWLAQGAHVKVREKLTWTGYVAAPNLDRDPPLRIGCPWGVNCCAILWNGAVVACPSDNEGRFVGGHVEHATIHEVWNGAMREFRARHLEHRWNELPDVCRACSDWQAVGAVHYTPDGGVYGSIMAAEPSVAKRKGA